LIRAAPTRTLRAAGKPIETPTASFSSSTQPDADLKPNSNLSFEKSHQHRAQTRQTPCQSTSSSFEPRRVRRRPEPRSARHPPPLCPFKTTIPSSHSSAIVSTSSQRRLHTVHRPTARTVRETYPSDSSPTLRRHHQAATHRARARRLPTSSSSIPTPPRAQASRAPYKRSPHTSRARNHQKCARIAHKDATLSRSVKLLFLSQNPTRARHLSTRQPLRLAMFATTATPNAFTVRAPAMVRDVSRVSRARWLCDGVASARIRRGENA
jgi:hypothetical protein